MNGQTPKKSRGCFFYGCISGLVLLLILLAGLVAGYLYFKKMLNNFTDTKPVQLPVVTLSDADAKKLHDRIDTFDKALKEHRDTPALVLTGDDINGWIATTPGVSNFTGKVYVTLDGDQIKGQMSLPLAQLGLSIFKDRYINGTATFKLVLRNGALHVNAQDITVKGNPIPSTYMEQIRQVDFAQQANSDPNNRATFERYEEIKIEDGKLIIVPKKPESETPKPTVPLESVPSTNR